MANNALVVSRTETFTIKGLEMKLKGIGVENAFSGLTVKELEGRVDRCAIVILYTDEDIVKSSEALVYMKDRCAEADNTIIVIGTKLEYEKIRKIIPQESILNFYERPLQMEKLLDDIERYMTTEANMEKRKSVLIVDDDVQYMSMISDWLKDSYRVSMANSGINAITWLATNRTDLILLDYEMPITPGPQVLEMLRSTPGTADIPVMFLTGNNDRDSIVKVVSLRPVDYLLITIDRKGLHEKLDNYFLSHPGK